MKKKMGLHIIFGILGNESDYDNLNWLVLGTTLAVVLSFSFFIYFFENFINIYAIYSILYFPYNYSCVFLTPSQVHDLFLYN